MTDPSNIVDATLLFESRRARREAEAVRITLNQRTVESLANHDITFDRGKDLAYRQALAFIRDYWDAEEKWARDNGDMVHLRDCTDFRRRFDYLVTNEIHRLRGDL
jgi:hypothetical protein